MNVDWGGQLNDLERNIEYLKKNETRAKKLYLKQIKGKISRRDFEIVKFNLPQI